jgi:hypothetical protein
VQATPASPHKTIAAVGQTLEDTMTRKPMREHAERKVNTMGILDVTLKER